MLVPTSAQCTMIYLKLLTNEEDVGDGAHHCAFHWMLLTNEEEVDDGATTAQRTMIHQMLLTNEEEADDGAHHCVEDDDQLDATHQ